MRAMSAAHMIFDTIYNHKELNNKRTCLYNNVKHEQNKYKKTLNGRVGNANGSWIFISSLLPLFCSCVCVFRVVVAVVVVVVLVAIAVVAVVLLLFELFIPSLTYFLWGVCYIINWEEKNVLFFHSFKAEPISFNYNSKCARLNGAAKQTLSKTKKRF